MKPNGLALPRPQQRTLLRAARKAKDPDTRARHMIVLHTAAGKSQRQIGQRQIAEALGMPVSGHLVKMNTARGARIEVRFMSKLCNRLYWVILANLLLWLAMVGSAFAPGGTTRPVAVAGLVFAAAAQSWAYYAIRRAGKLEQMHCDSSDCAAGS